MHRDNVRKILITGANGFIGRYFLKRLSSEIKIVIIGRKSTMCLPHDIYGKKNIQYIQHDLCTPLPDQVINDIKSIDTVVHLATIMPDKITPHDDFELVVQNISCTTNLLRILRFLPNIRTFVLGSTVDVYPWLASPLDEDVCPSPLSNYGASKLACELICKSEIAKRPDTRLSILRLSQVYGPNDTHSKAIPQFIKNAIDGKTIQIFGDGNDQRSFLYVEDAAMAIELAVKKSIDGVFNIAGEMPHTIREAAILVKEFAPASPEIEFLPGRKESFNSIINIDRARQILEYTPEYSLAEGIRLTIAEGH